MRGDKKQGDSRKPTNELSYRTDMQNGLKASNITVEQRFWQTSFPRDPTAAICRAPGMLASVRSGGLMIISVFLPATFTSITYRVQHPTRVAICLFLLPCYRCPNRSLAMADFKSCPSVRLPNPTYQVYIDFESCMSAMEPWAKCIG